MRVHYTQELSEIKWRKKLKAGDKVHCMGDSGFCDPHHDKIKKITTQYNEKTGKPYKVIWLSDGHKFDSRDGWAMNPPLAYYIVKP